MEFYKQQKDVMLAAANKWLTGLIFITTCCLPTLEIVNLFCVI